MSERIEVIKLSDHLYLMDDNHESTGYIVIGSKKALVIDTMNGYQDVKEVVRRYTNLPLMVVNTHGHPDHIWGNVYFDEVYLNPDDWHIATEAAMDKRFVDFTSKQGLSMPPFRDLLPGDEIDLGGLHIDVIGLAGHTPGSVLLLLKEDRVLFTGDSINHHLWMQLHHCTSLEIYKNNLEKIMYLLDEADTILHGHTREFDDISLITDVYTAVCEILDGNTTGDEPYKWFGGEGKTHPIPKNNGVICFNPVSETVKRERREWATSDAKRDAGLKEPEDVFAYKDINYGLFGEDSLLDVYIPKALMDKNKRLPVLINVHGGGYFYGDKELYRFYAMDMSRRGFIVVNMNYRRSPEYTFPSPLQDINEVMRFIEIHGEEYGMDTQNVFMMGDSAGAQLTSHYAAINSNLKFAAMYALKPMNIKLKGICLACGVYDIPVAMKDTLQADMFENYLSEFSDPTLPIIDVLSAINKDYPDTFIFSCPNDFLFEACEPMYKLINERGAKATMKIYGTKEMKEVGHVFHCNMKLPIGEEARADQASFLLSLVN